MNAALRERPTETLTIKQRVVEQIRPTLEVLTPTPVPSAAGSGKPSSKALAQTLVFCVTMVIVAGIVGLFSAVELAHGAFEQKKLRVELSKLSDHERVLSETLNTKESPAALCQSARALGMQPSSGVSFIQLPEGKIVTPQRRPESALLDSSVQVCAGK